jgi:hypothetical protein
MRYPDCWRCGESLGCDQCGGVITEVLCVRCVAWGTLDALLEHGPILNTPAMVAKRRGRSAPQIQHYPVAWASAYRSMERPELDSVPSVGSLSEVVKLAEQQPVSDAVSEEDRV